MRSQGEVFTLCPIGECVIEKIFYSKKNNVYLVRTPSSRHVVKEYNVHDRETREEQMFKTLEEKNVSIPELIYSCDNYIIMEYIDGSTLLDEFCKAEKSHSNIDELAHGFAGWLRSFYNGTKDAYGCQAIVGDVNFRNFIIKDRFYGIDFEDCRRGNIEEDAGRVCAFFICYEPAFTEWKKQMAGNLFKVLVRDLKLDPDYVKSEFKKELSMIEKRRKLYIPEGIASHMLEKYLK